MNDNTCFNDVHKRILTEDIEAKLKDVLDHEVSQILKAPVLKDFIGDLEPLLDMLSQQVTKKSSEAISQKTQVKDLIEYSRAIHAEMDAIISLARQKSYSTKKCILYTTTYPCHNCARHIVTAGIEKVIYIEPYEKSLATKLHHDTISKNTEMTEKVSVLPFEGVSPKRYYDFFKSHKKRKNAEGKAIKIKVSELNHIMPVYLDSYRDRELKVVEHMQDILGFTEEQQRQE